MSQDSISDEETECIEGLSSANNEVLTVSATIHGKFSEAPTMTVLEGLPMMTLIIDVRSMLGVPQDSKVHHLSMDKKCLLENSKTLTNYYSESMHKNRTMMIDCFRSSFETPCANCFSFNGYIEGFCSICHENQTRVLDWFFHDPPGVIKMRSIKKVSHGLNHQYIIPSSVDAAFVLRAE
jgi:hypothetical protein